MFERLLSSDDYESSIAEVHNFLENIRHVKRGSERYSRDAWAGFDVKVLDIRRLS
jgi:hypothetical protein